jgi:hypothetical protein
VIANKEGQNTPADFREGQHRLESKQTIVKKTARRQQFPNSKEEEIYPSIPKKTTAHEIKA